VWRFVLPVVFLFAPALCWLVLFVTLCSLQIWYCNTRLWLWITMSDVRHYSKCAVLASYFGSFCGHHCTHWTLCITPPPSSLVTQLPEVSAGKSLFINIKHLPEKCGHKKPCNWELCGSRLAVDMKFPTHIHIHIHRFFRGYPWEYPWIYPYGYIMDISMDISMDYL